MSDPLFIVAEISKTWPSNIIEGTLNELFEQCVNANLARGYEIHSWKFNTSVIYDTSEHADYPRQITECIVAIFRKIPDNDYVAALANERDQWQAKAAQLCRLIPGSCRCGMHLSEANQ